MKQIGGIDFIKSSHIFPGHPLSFRARHELFVIPSEERVVCHSERRMSRGIEHAPLFCNFERGTSREILDFL